jgi:hypothetical protein
MTASTALPPAARACRPASCANGPVEPTTIARSPTPEVPSRSGFAVPNSR